MHFNTALTGLERKNGRLVGITTTNGSFACETLVFAVGHSARDTFSMLMDSGLVLECKPFSVGFRAEHLQTEIEKSLYTRLPGIRRCLGVNTSSPSTLATGACTPSVCAPAVR